MSEIREQILNFNFVTESIFGLEGLNESVERFEESWTLLKLNIDFDLVLCLCIRLILCYLVLLVWLCCAARRHFDYATCSKQ